MSLFFLLYSAFLTSVLYSLCDSPVYYYEFGNFTNSERVFVDCIDDIDFPVAKTFCENNFNSGFLSSFTAQAQIDNLANYIPNSYTNRIFIGAQRHGPCNDPTDGSSAEWEWINGDIWSYTNWEYNIGCDSNQPNQCAQTIVKMRSPYDSCGATKWRDNPTSSPSNPNSGFMCKYVPTVKPTKSPSSEPTKNPSKNPSNQPTQNPSEYPSLQPSEEPSVIPTNNPSTNPTEYPSTNPSVFPSDNPSLFPSNLPTFFPSVYPTFFPSNNPSKYPSKSPNNDPTIQPSHFPSVFPSSNPSMIPSVSPSNFPFIPPTFSPTTQDTKNSTNGGLDNTLLSVVIALSLMIFIILIIFVYLGYRRKRKQGYIDKHIAHIDLQKVSSTDSIHLDTMLNKVSPQPKHTSGYTGTTLRDVNETKGKLDTDLETDLQDEELYSDDQRKEDPTVGKDTPYTPKKEETKQFVEEGENNVEKYSVSNWNVDKVIEWLNISVGLSEYSQNFKDNKINGKLLLGLNLNVLKEELEIKPYGDRVKIIEAIDKLKEQM